MATNDLIPGGRLPSRAAVAVYLFGPFLLDEFSRYRFAVVRAMQAGTESSTGEGGALEPARLSMKRLVDILEIEMPPDWTAPIPRADCRGRDGSFHLNFDRKILTAYRKGITESGDPFFTRLVSFIKDDEPGAAWHHIMQRFQGAYYHNTASYQALLANIATILGGVQLFILKELEGQGAASFLQSAPTLWQRFDSNELHALARKHGVSMGLVIAGLVQLCARKNSPQVRLALAKKDPTERFELLEQALWAPLFPNFRGDPKSFKGADPHYTIAMEKVVNPEMRPRTGRPPRVEVPKPPALPPAQNEAAGGEGKHSEQPPLPLTTPASSPQPSTPVHAPATDEKQPSLVAWNSEQDQGAGLSPILKRKPGST